MPTSVIIFIRYNSDNYFAGPDDPMFKRFKTWFLNEAGQAQLQNRAFPDPGTFVLWQWEDTSPSGPYRSSLDWFARSTLTWVQDHLAKGTFPREDYRELCELLKIVLGGDVSILFTSQSYSLYADIYLCVLNRIQYCQQLIHFDFSQFDCEMVNRWLNL